MRRRTGSPAGRWHDGEVADTEQRISPLRPHDLRYTFAFQLAHATRRPTSWSGRLGHRYNQ